MSTTIVPTRWSGSFYFEIDKDQQVPIEQKRDANGAIMFKSQPLSSPPIHLVSPTRDGGAFRATTAFDFGIQ
jgi:hypothetical protein